MSILKLRDYLTIREAGNYLGNTTGTQPKRAARQIIELIKERKLFVYRNEAPSYDYQDKAAYTLSHIENGSVPDGDYFHIKRKEIDALLESLHAKSTSQTDQTKLEKQMQEKIDVLSAKIEQLESENSELKKQVKNSPTASTYTIAGALIELITDQRTPKRNQSTLKLELEEKKLKGVSEGSLNNLFASANKALKDSKAKG